jgi:hypothetical protein
VQERPGRCVDGNLVALSRHIEPVERLDRRLRLALGRAEGCEIVMADQHLRGLVHGLCVEGV